MRAMCQNFPGPQHGCPQRRRTNYLHAQRLRRGVTPGFAGIAVLLLCLGNANRSAAASDSSAAPPPVLYNQGTQKFHEGKLREAEASLQTALASQDEKVQIPALYNLGHVRFREGV